MITLTQITLGFAVMLLLMLAGLHVGVVMFILSILGAAIFISPAILASLGNQIWADTDNYVLLAIPMFVLLGELLVRGGSTDKIYSSLSDWLGSLTGGLLHTNIGASAMFAAVSGSSVATAATIGRVALPALETRHYSPQLVLGSIAAGATLGILIPPSINMIIYGAMTNTSVGRLYAAGVVPGILLTLLFMTVIVVLCKFWPQLARDEVARISWATRLKRSVDLLPMVLIFVIVMGSIYLGWATPTEAAAVGVMCALLLLAVYRNLSLQLINECLLATVQITALIVLIVTGAACLNYVLGILGVPQALAGFLSDIGATQIQFILMLLVFYIILGTFLETLAMMIGTIPVVFPIVVAMGIDPVWFGIFLVIMCEISLITPPTGMNLYVVQGVRGNHGSIMDVMVGTLPFLFMMILLVGLIVVMPDLVLWLPNWSFGPG